MQTVIIVAGWTDTTLFNTYTIDKRAAPTVPRLPPGVRALPHPKHCVYLDDLGVNLKPAREMGMTTIKVLNAPQALAELEAATGLSLR